MNEARTNKADLRGADAVVLRILALQSEDSQRIPKRNRGNRQHSGRVDSEFDRVAWNDIRCARRDAGTLLQACDDEHARLRRQCARTLFVVRRRHPEVGVPEDRVFALTASLPGSLRVKPEPIAEAMGWACYLALTAVPGTYGLVCGGQWSGGSSMRAHHHSACEQTTCRVEKTCTARWPAAGTQRRASVNS
jgi:hypothetical protein